VTVPGVLRDPIDERRQTIATVDRRLEPAAQRLSDLASYRAGPAPIEDLDGRDFDRETIEELADARNYLLWWRRQANRLAAEAGDDVTAARVRRADEHLAEALAAVVAACHAVDEASGILRGATRPPRPALAEAIKVTAERFPSCRCRLEPSMTNGELVALGAGCTDPRWSCPRLAAVRRAVL
jgi:hypothetical protein